MKGIMLVFLTIIFPGLLMSQGNASYSGEEFEQAFVPCKTGGTIVYSGENHSFTIEIKAKDLKNTGQPNYFLVDNQIVQAAILPIPKKEDLQSLSAARQREILKAYINYELDYFKNTLKQDYSNLSIEWMPINGQQFAYWHFDMPHENNKHVKKQIYLSTICFNQILDLNAPVFDDYFRAKEILNQMAGSVKLYNSHLDLAAIATPAKN